MPIACFLRHDLRLVVANAEGPIGLRDIEDYLHYLVVYEAMPYRKLFNGLHAEPHLDDEDARLLDARIRSYKAFDPRGPLAIVATSGAALHEAMRFLTLGDAGRAARIFPTEAEARAWLDTFLPEQPATVRPSGRRDPERFW